ncbi:MAG: transposase family protein [Pseudonocardiaceae bacterium]
MCDSALRCPVGRGGRPELSTAAVEGPDLLRRFGAVSDGRSEQGRDHPVAVVLTLCAAAVLGGMRSFTAIAGWVADVPAEVLARLYARPARYPSKTTRWRVLTGADAAAVDAAISAWLLAQATAQAARQRASDAGASAGAALVAVAVTARPCAAPSTPTALRCTCWPRPPTPTRWS